MSSSLELIISYTHHHYFGVSKDRILLKSIRKRLGRNQFITRNRWARGKHTSRARGRANEEQENNRFYFCYSKWRPLLGSAFLFSTVFFTSLFGRTTMTGTGEWERQYLLTLPILIIPIPCHERRPRVPTTTESGR